MSTFRRWWFILFDDAGAPGAPSGHVVRLVNVTMIGASLANVSLAGATLSGASLSGPTLTNVSIT